MQATTVADFCSVAVHIGEELRKRIKASGIPITRVAKYLRTTPQTLHTWFKKESCDTGVLVEASRILRFDFFKLYSSDLGLEPSLSMAAEPQAAYRRSAPQAPATVEITIKSSNASGDLIERIVKAVDGSDPEPNRDKVAPISRSSTTRKPRRSR